MDKTENIRFNLGFSTETTSYRKKSFNAKSAANCANHVQTILEAICKVVFFV